MTAKNKGKDTACNPFGSDLLIELQKLLEDAKKYKSCLAQLPNTDHKYKQGVFLNKKISPMEETTEESLIQKTRMIP